MAVEPFRCGAIALIGRPNVGKSTLLNALLGQKLSITSHKPQTTRQSLRGVLTTGTAQFVIIDTPGFQTRYRGALNRAMNRAIRGALEAVDVVALVVEAKRFGAEDRALLKQVPRGVPLFLVGNKIDVADPELGRVGLSAAPADAAADVRARVHWVSSLAGGHGAVRELIELILREQGRWEGIVAAYLREGQQV